MISDLGGKPRLKRLDAQQVGSPSGGSTPAEKAQDSKDGAVQVTPA